MIQRTVDFALGHRLLVISMGVLLMLWGIYSFHTLPIEAYPDVCDTWCQVITQWPGHAAEEVEQQVTIPLELQLNGIPHLARCRSNTIFGLSVISLFFDEDAENLQSRAQVLEKLSMASLPAGLTPQIGPDGSPTGQIYFFTLECKNKAVDLMEQKALMDWVVYKYLKSVPNITDCAVFGGTTQEYQVKVDPTKLVSRGLSLPQVEQAIAANNVNTGGSFIQYGQQAINVRCIGLVRTAQDIGATVLKTVNGTPVRVRDLAVVEQGPKIRLGQQGKCLRREDGVAVDNPDVVAALLQMRTGAETESTLVGVHKMVEELNGHILPKGVRIVPHIDRDELVHHTTHTVLHNMTEGILLVVLVLCFFIGNLRSALIVSATIPFSLFTAATLLDLKHIPANLLSLGALDFGMIVDGSVVMIENIFRHLSELEDGHVPFHKRISRAAHEVQRPVFYSIFIIITAYFPIFTLQRVEGRLFRPMAWTVAFSLLGALIFGLILAPVLASLLFTEGMREWRNPVLRLLTWGYRRTLAAAIRYRALVVLASLGLIASSLYLALSGIIGSEFLPHLDEGAIWVRGTLAPSTGPDEGIRISTVARRMLAQFPEVTQVVSQVGRPDDGTDATGFFNTEYFVDLKLKEKWRQEFHQDKEALIAAMNEKLQTIPGVLWNFSQPISDNVEEAISGVKGELSVKLYGDDLKQLESKADEIVGQMKKVSGVADLGIFRVVGQPNANIIVDRNKIDRFGINVADVQAAVEGAVGGAAVSQVLQGERRYDITVRYLPQFRNTLEEIAAVRLQAPSGEYVSLAQLCTIRVEDGACEIYREGNSRYIAIKYSVRGRDLGSTVEECMAKVGAGVEIPKGMRLDWAGEYESQKRAERRLLLIIPLTVLMIFMIIYGAFNSAKWATLMMFNIAVGPVGGMLALLLTGTHFSVSSGVGFLALFGVSIQTGVIMVEYMNQLRARGFGIDEAALEGAVLRLRPIIMTMMVATLGLLPAATSHDIGSDSQRPFAIVIVGGLLAELLVSAYLVPCLYSLMARDTDELPYRQEHHEKLAVSGAHRPAPTQKDH